MPNLSAEVLSQAIENEIHARELYRELSNKLEIAKSRDMMINLSEEEDRHCQILSARYKSLFDKDYEPAAGISGGSSGTAGTAGPGGSGEARGPDSAGQNGFRPSGPEFELLQASTFENTDLFEVIRLAIGAEEEAAVFYSKQLAAVSESSDIKMLKNLIRFEKSHKKKLEKELERLTKKYS